MNPDFFSLSLHAFSVGLRVRVCNGDLAVFAAWCLRGALHEENLLQTAAALLHSAGHRDSLFQRALSAHPRGRVHFHWFY